MNQLPPEVSQLIDAAILEDQTFNDPTSQVLIPTDVEGKGMLRAKANGILAGIDVAKACLLYTSPSPRDKRQSRMPSSA